MSITKQNIKELLEYNEVDSDIYLINEDCITIFFYDTDNCENSMRIYYNNPLFKNLLEVYLGTLSSPIFNFKQYLINSGYFQVFGYEKLLSKAGDFLLTMEGDRVSFASYHSCYAYKTTKELANKLISMVKFLQSLIEEE